MGFDVAALSYDRFMGRYSARLAPRFADFGGIAGGQRALDVGCGPGALTTELVARLGADGVAAVDPSPSFAAAARERHPGVAVEQAPAEKLPFADGEFDAAAAQLVVHFMSDPIAGLREMARVTRASGVVIACVWDHAGQRTPLGPFWRAVRELDPDAHDESQLAGAGEGQLAELFEQAGLRLVTQAAIDMRIRHASFEEWWQPFTLGVGPAGAYVAALDTGVRAALRERCLREFAGGEIALDARVWAVRARP